MKKRLFLYYFLFIFIILSVSSSIGANYPKRFNKQINDYGNVLKEEDKKIITDTIKKLETETKIDLTLLTIDSVSTYQGVTIEKLGKIIFKNWQIGGTENSRGILVLFALNDRQIRIQMGPAYGNTMDKDMKNIVDKTVNTFFINELYSAGLKSLIENVANTAPGAGVTLGGTWINISKEKLVWYTGIGLVVIFYILAVISYAKDNKQGWGYWVIFYTGIVLITTITVLLTILLSGGRGHYHNRHHSYGGGLFSGSIGGGSWSGGGSSGGGFSGGGATGKW